MNKEDLFEVTSFTDSLSYKIENKWMDSYPFPWMNTNSDKPQVYTRKHTKEEDNKLFKALEDEIRGLKKEKQLAKEIERREAQMLRDMEILRRREEAAQAKASEKLGASMSESFHDILRILAQPAVVPAAKEPPKEPEQTITITLTPIPNKGDRKISFDL